MQNIQIAQGIQLRKSNLINNPDSLQESTTTTIQKSEGLQSELQQGIVNNKQRFIKSVVNNFIQNDDIEKGGVGSGRHKLLVDAHKQAKGILENYNKDKPTDYQGKVNHVAAENRVAETRRALREHIEDHYNKHKELLDSGDHDLNQKMKDKYSGKTKYDDIQKSHSFPIGTVHNDIEKGHTANIGEIHTWNGKKYKKQANGKWKEVSESHRMTKEEHEEKAKFHYEEGAKNRNIALNIVRNTGKKNLSNKNEKLATQHFKEDDIHNNEAKNLDDKEYDGSDLGMEEQSFNPNGIMQKKEITEDELKIVASNVDKLSHINRIRFDRMMKEHFQDNEEPNFEEDVNQYEELEHTPPTGDQTVDDLIAHASYRDEEGIQDLFEYSDQSTDEEKDRAKDFLLNNELVSFDGDEDDEEAVENWSREMSQNGYKVFSESDGQLTVAYKPKTNTTVSDNGVESNVPDYSKSKIRVTAGGHQQGGLSKDVFETKSVQNYGDSFGAIAHEDRTSETDKVIEDRLRVNGLNSREIGAYIVSKYGRHLMNSVGTGIYKAGEKAIDKYLNVRQFRQMLDKVGGIEKFEELV